MGAMPEPAASQGESRGPAADLERIAAGLPSVFPGAVVVDRELRLDPAPAAAADGPGAAIDLAAVDGEGRLLCVCLVRGDGAEAALLALDALAFAQENLALLARHFPGAGLDPELPPLVVLAAERFEPRLLTRLGGFDPARLACLEIRRLASRERTETYLVPLVPTSGPGAARQAARPADFLQHLDPELRPLAERLLERLARIDEDLRATSSGRQLRFTLDGEPVCALQAQGDLLEARVVPDGGTFRIGTPADADAFLEEVLQRTLELFEPRERGGSLLAPPERDGLRAAAFDPLLPSGAILTPEEIEAFRSLG